MAGWQLGIGSGAGNFADFSAYPLSPPVLFYDTRKWNGMTNSAVIPNEGSAGSGFNLVVTEPTTNVLRAAVASGINWNVLGGEGCDTPFTLMVVHDYTNTILPNNVEARVRWPTVAPVAVEIGTNTSGNTPRYFMDLDGGGSVVYTTGGYIQSAIDSRFYTLTLNAIDSEAWVWRGDSEVSPVYTVGDCNSIPDPSSGVLDILLQGNMYFNSVPADRGLTILGMVLYRGIPTEDEINFTKAYFATPQTSQPFSYTVDSVYDTPFPATGFVTRREWFDATYCYHWLEFNPNSTNNAFRFADFNPIPGATLPSTIDFVLVGAGGNAAAETGGANRRGGGAAGGQVVQVSGHTAPTSTTRFEPNVSFGTSGSVKFEGYAAGGRPSGTSFTFIGPNGQAAVYGGGTLGGTGTLSPTGGGGGAGAGGNGGNSSGTTGGAAGAGIAGWHWSGTTKYHGCGGPGGGSVVGSRPQAVGLGWGAQGTFSGTQGGGPAGLVVRYLRQY